MCVAIRVRLVSTVAELSELHPVLSIGVQSFAWKAPLKGTCFCVAAGMANAATRIMAAVRTNIAGFVMGFICTPLELFDVAASLYPAHLLRIRIGRGEGYRNRRE